MARSSSSSVSASAGTAWSRLTISRALCRTGGLGRSGESEETPTLAERRIRLLGDEPEPLPAIGGLGVGIGGRLPVPAGLGEGGGCSDEGVLSIGIASLVAGHETPGEIRGADPEGDPHHRGQEEGVEELMRAPGNDSSSVRSAAAARSSPSAARAGAAEPRPTTKSSAPPSSLKEVGRITGS